MSPRQLKMPLLEPAHQVKGIEKSFYTAKILQNKTAFYFK